MPLLSAQKHDEASTGGRPISTRNLSQRRRKRELTLEEYIVNCIIVYSYKDL